MNKKIVKKRFDLQITEQNKITSKTFELEKNITSIKGLLINSDRDDLLYYRGSQKIEINAEEIFPEGYESKLLMSGINIPPRGRYYALGNVPPGNGLVRVEYKDIPDARAPFIPYRVSLYLRCEMIDEE